MENYSCKICCIEFGTTERIPFVLLKCAHTVCSTCLESIGNSCPFCKSHIEKRKPNDEMIRYITKALKAKETENELKKIGSKEYLDSLLNLTESLLKDLHTSKDLKHKSNSEKFQVIKSQIEAKTNELVKQVYQSRDIIVDETKTIEAKMKKQLNDVLLKDKQVVDKKLAQAKNSLKKSDFKEEDYDKLTKDLNEKKKLLADKIIQLNKPNKVNYVFISNSNIDITKDFIGKIDHIKLKDNGNQKYLVDAGEDVESIIPIADFDVSTFPSIESKAVRKPSPHQGLSNIYLLRCQKCSGPEKAIELLDKALKLEPHFYETNEMKATILLTLRRFKEAIEYFEKCIQIGPTVSSGYVGKGMCLNALHKYQEAISYYDKSLDLDAQDYVSNYNKGMCYNQLKNYQKAVDSFDKAIAIDTEEECYLGKGTALFFLGKYQESIDCFKKARRLDPTDTNYAHVFASSYLGLGKYSECVKFIDETLQVSMTNEQRKQLLTLRTDAQDKLKKK